MGALADRTSYNSSWTVFKGKFLHSLGLPNQSFSCSFSQPSQESGEFPQRLFLESLRAVFEEIKLQLPGDSGPRNFGGCRIRP